MRNLPIRGLCSSTPRGDGNTETDGVISGQGIEVYAAQPREGTETHGL